MHTRVFVQRAGLLTPTLLLLLLTITPICAVASPTLNQTPQGAVLFITDGLGAYYMYPELKALAQDNSLLEHESLFANLTSGARVLQVYVPVPKTGPGHSVIITGDRDATPEEVPEDVTVFDVLRGRGFVVLGVLERGDFSGMRDELDAVLYAESNSIYKPVFRVQDNGAPERVLRVMEAWRGRVEEYLGDTTGMQRYVRYNRFAIEAASEIVEVMLQQGQPFVLIVNAGGLDSAAHYTNYSVYHSVLQGLDRNIPLLKSACKAGNLAFFFTADHGMSFKTPESRGGHSGKAYRYREESHRVPLVITSGNVQAGTVEGRWGQEDVAPTLLAVLDVPNLLKGDGEVIPVKSHANLYLLTDADYVELYRDGVLVDNQSGRDITFRNLMGDYRVRGFKDGVFHEEVVSVSRDVTLRLQIPQRSDSISPLYQLSPRHILGVVLIVIVNLSGILLIRRLKD